MKIEFTARHFHAPENLKDYTLTEVSRIQKYFDRITQCQVILIRENNTFTTEINLSMPKHRLNVKETTPKVTKSIDGAVEKMISRVTKITDKWKSH